MNEIFKNSLLEEVANFTGEYESIMPCTKCKPMKNLVNIGKMSELEIVLYTLSERRKKQIQKLMKSLCGRDITKLESEAEALYSFGLIRKNISKVQKIELKKWMQDEDFFIDIMWKMIQSRIGTESPGGHLHLHPDWVIMCGDTDEVNEDSEDTKENFTAVFMGNIVGEA